MSMNFSVEIVQLLQSQPQVARENKLKYLLSASFCLGKHGALLQHFQPSRARGNS